MNALVCACARTRVCVCTIPSWCLVESDPSMSGAFSEIMEATVSE